MATLASLDFNRSPIVKVVDIEPKYRDSTFMVVDGNVEGRETV